MKNKIINEFEQSKKHLKRISSLIKKIQFCDVTEGHLMESVKDAIDDINSLKEQFEYFYHKEKENIAPIKVIV